jgi:signal transduction histidine kinase
VTDEAERRRIERVLAVARVYLAVLAFIAFYMNPTDPIYYRSLVNTLLAFYVLSATVILYSVGSLTRMTAQFTNFIHFTDILWAAVITSFTSGPHSPFFNLLTVFALLAAGHRWGLHEALATALLCIQVLLLQTYPWGATGPVELQLSTLITPATFVFITAFLVGFLADAEKQLRGEANALARTMRHAQTERGLRTSLQLILGDLLKLFGPQRIDLAARDTLSGAVSLWRIDRKRPDHVQLVQEESAAVETLLAADLPAAVYVRVLNRKAAPVGFVAIDTAGRRIPDADPEVAARFTREVGGQTILSVGYSDPANVTARIVLVDPDVVTPGADLRFLQMLTQQVSPGLHNLYLLTRLRTRIGAVERSRVARELHDGVIQTVIGLEMEIEAMRRKVAADDPVAARLKHVQELLHEEAVTLRELMQQMKPLDLRNSDFVAFVATTVDRFGRDSGIVSSFASGLDELALPPRVGRELGRIVQEALVNIRRHAGARNVVVRLRIHAGELILLIDDDGRGFGFTGRLEGSELDRSSRGPLTIKERARALGAAVAVESLPDLGSRVEIRLPLNRAGIAPMDQSDEAVLNLP